MKIKEAIANGQNVRGDESFCFFLAVLYPADQLKILEYNRVVKDLNGLTEEVGGWVGGWVSEWVWSVHCAFVWTALCISVCLDVPLQPLAPLPQKKQTRST